MLVVRIQVVGRWMFTGKMFIFVLCLRNVLTITLGGNEAKTKRKRRMGKP